MSNIEAIKKFNLFFINFSFYQLCLANFFIFLSFQVSSDIIKDFPRLLDRACNKHQNGVVVIIDSIDLITNYRESFKWLLDPQPVTVRVIVSVAGAMNSSSSSLNHPKQWHKWFSLVLDGKPSNATEIVKLCDLEMHQKMDDGTTAVEPIHSKYKNLFETLLCTLQEEFNFAVTLIL